MASKFAAAKTAPPIEVFEVVRNYNEDKHEKKVNLSIGAYRTDDSKPWVLPVVRQVEAEMGADDTANHEYLPILGLPEFANAAMRMCLGEDCKAIKEERATAVQTLSGTGALRLCADTLRRLLGSSVFYYSNPTWGNHKTIFADAGFTEGRPYRYWDGAARGLDFAGMLEDLGGAPEGAVIILHSCAHNPTGVDPSQDQWRQLAELVKTRGLFPVFDTAYQGFATGDLDKDAWAVRYFAEQGFEMMVTQSFAKNFGLYNERVGNLTSVFASADVVTAVRSQMTLIVRASYSNPPNHGARVVARVLNDPKLFEEWRAAIRTMASRIAEMRDGLRSRLEKLGTPGQWDHITSQIGMFSYTGLSATQVKMLKDKYHIYLLSSGRVNICGLTTKNIDYVAEGINDVVVNAS